MKWRWIIGVVVLAVIGASVAGVHYAIVNVLPYSPIRPHRATPDEVRAIHPGLIDPASVGLTFDTFDVDVEPTIQLKGWFVHAASDTRRGTILLLHGIGTSRYAMVDHAKLLSASGFNCVLFDSRANGESGGVNCTFGYYEKRDVHYVIDAVQRTYPLCGPIGIYGNSLGAAIAIQAMGVDDRICCGVVESPFATLREVIHDYFQQKFIISMPWIPDAALERSEVIAQFVVDSVRPESSARSITHPVMVTHGSMDANINIGYGRRVFEAIACKDKQWRVIDGGTHNDLGAVGGATYANEVLAFFRSRMHP